MKIIANTTKCVRCFAPASVFTGNVTRGKEEILAGWCKLHEKWTQQLFFPGGWCGHWVPDMGYEVEQRVKEAGK